MDAQTSTSPFLALPREIRDQIISEVIFPGEKQPESLEQDRLGLAPTAVRQIFVYDPARKPKLDVAVIRVCQQLQDEAEAILYGTSSFNLMYADWSDPVKYSFEFFQKLSRRLRRLVRRVERKCYSEVYSKRISLFDWCAFARMLANEMPNLQSLVLWGPGDYNEGLHWVPTCREDKEWVRALLQIKSLRRFDIPMIPGGSIESNTEFTRKFLPWLKHSLTKTFRPVPDTVVEKRPTSSFPFFNLPREVRDMVYRYLALPADGRIHIGIGSWYDGTTRDAFNAIVSCRQLHQEVSTIIFKEATFATERPKYNAATMSFMKDHHCAQKWLPRSLVGNPWPIKHLSLAITDPRRDLQDLPWLVKRARLESLQLAVSVTLANVMRRSWQLCQGNTDGSNYGLWQGGFRRCQLIAIAHVPYVVLRGSCEAEACAASVQAECLDWIQRGLRRELLKGRPEMESLEWLYAGLNEEVFEPLYPRARLAGEAIG